MNDRIFLLDGTGLLYRAHFAFLRNPRITSSGEVVSAVFGLANTLVRILKQEKPAGCAVAFDTGAPTFRHERYAEYKAHRPPMPPELISQGPRARALLRAMGVQVVERDGVEADDLIGVLALEARRAGMTAVIVSADKDFMQLVGDGIIQWIPSRGSEPEQWIDPDGVRAKWGVGPEQIIDLLALMGDASDNVPGVPGVGEKTAVKLLQEFGSLDDLYRRLDEVLPRSVKEKLARARASAELSRELVTIRTDLSLPCALDDLRVAPLGSNPALRPLLADLEFHQLLSRLETQGERVWEARYRTIATREELLAYLKEWRRTPRPLALDTETDSIDARRAKPVGVSLAFESGEAVYVPLAHEGGPNLPAEDLKDALAPILADPEVELVGQNCKFDLHVLRRLGLRTRARIRDTLLASYLIDPEGTHNLDALAERHLGHTMIPIAALIGEGRDEITMDRVDVAKATEYAAEDADAALRLDRILRPMLVSQRLLPLWEDLECALVPVLLEMEQAGIRVDVPWLMGLSRQFSERIEELSREIQTAAGQNFNPASPAQLARVLFEDLKLKKGRKTKTGYSTDSDVLEELADLHPVPRLVLEFRMLAKLKGTYVDTLPELVDPGTGRVHTTFAQAVAATGRLASHDPNLQNIPIRTPLGREIRRGFVAEEGSLLVCADYSQVELRILAHLSGDVGLIAAFREGRDIHAATAERLFGVSSGEIDLEMRARAKTVNFGVIYGMGPQRLARELGIPIAQAKRFIEEYFAKMPSVRGYLESGLATARRDGFTTTLFGRVRVVRDLNATDARRRAQAERIVANTPIQGSAADLIKRAMIRAHAALLRAGLEARLLLQVHDELMVEAPAHEVEEVERLLVEAMEGAASLAVPLKVEVGQGRNWSEAHP